MIFNENVNSMSSSNVKVSPYPLGYAGALMHVYENEINYNALMKSVGISELKYYSETGKDLFVNEAGAFSGFIAKAKEFFKKVIEKIKSIFKTFMAKINSFIISDKEFVKKYEKDIRRKDITDMEFTGYEKFKDGFSNPLDKITYDTADYIAEKINEANNNDYIDTDSNKYTSDELQNNIESDRAKIINQSGKLTESEFRDELKDMLYGDKETFDVTTSHITAALDVISNSKKMITDVEKEQKKVTTAIDKFIKALEKSEKNYATRDSNGKLPEHMDKVTGNINDNIAIAKAYSNDITIAFGMLSGAAKDANRQAKALCVKVLSYKPKNESAMYSKSYSDNDLFAGVDFA